MSQNRPTAPDIVTAVLVAHDGARWLPETLDAVQKQTRRPDRFVAADNGSRDRGPALLEEAFGAERIISLPRSTGYGAAIAHALRLPAASVSVPVPAAPGDPVPVEWIWLLHDDSAPDPRALANLLETAARDPRARVIGPKVRDWHNHRELLEAGVTIDRAGRRETGLEPHELDQGQRDGDREVLAVGSAGMLVRRDVWNELGGFDPRIALFRDDLDFCWRAGGAGYKVLLTTTAIVYHAEASARRRRRISTGGQHPLRVDRQNALYVLFANLPAGALWVSMLRGFFGSLLRTLLFLLAKQPGAAIDELAAVAHAYGRPVRLLMARRERARNRRRSYSAIRPFMARGLAAARLAAMFGGVFGGAGPMASAGRHQAGTFGEEEDEEAELLSDSRGPVRRALSNPGVLLFLALAVVSVAAERSLLFGGALGGGALVPVTGGASDLWRQYVEGYHAVGLGSADAAPPATAIVALVSTVLGGSVPAAVGLLLLGCVPFAGLVVYFATRGILPYRPARVWLAASYALLPVATGAIAAGRLGTAVAIVVIPLIGVFFAKLLGEQGARSRRAAWAAGLLLAVAMAFVPLVWPLAVIVGGLVAVAFGGREEDRPLFVNVGIAVLTPPILLGPWAWSLFAHPSRFLLEIGLHRAALSDPALSAESLLLLSPGGPGVPPVWTTAGFLVVGLVALSLRKHRVLIAAGWVVTLFGLLVAILVSRMTPEPATGGAAIAAWPGVALVVAAGGLLMTAAIAAGPVWELVQEGGWRRATGIALVVIACSSPVLAAGAWVWRGADGPLDRQPDNVMPPAVAALSGNRTSTLVVRPENGAVAYSVLRGRVPMFGEDQIRPPEEARARLDALVSGLMSGRGGDDGHALAQYGIRFVLVPGAAVQGSVHRLDGVPGMSRMTMTSQYAVWRVTGPTARVWIDGPDGSVTAIPGAPSATIPAGKAGRVLETAEPFDGGWSATLNGHDLKPVELHGWAQGFQLPASGGRLEIDRGTFLHDSWIWTQALALVVLIVLALPGARRDPDAEDAEEPKAAARAAARAKRKRQRQHQPRRARGHRRVDQPDEPAALHPSKELPALPSPEPAGPLSVTANAFQALQAGQYHSETEPGARQEPERPAEPGQSGSAEPRPDAGTSLGARPDLGGGTGREPGWTGSSGPEGDASPAFGWDAPREPGQGVRPEPGPDAEQDERMEVDADWFADLKSDRDENPAFGRHPRQEPDHDVRPAFGRGADSEPGLGGSADLGGGTGVEPDRAASRTPDRDASPAFGWDVDQEPGRAGNAAPGRRGDPDRDASPAMGWDARPEPVRDVDPVSGPEAIPGPGFAGEHGPGSGPNPDQGGTYGGRPDAGAEPVPERPPGYGAGRSGLAAYVREPDWSTGRGTGEPRPDPLAGTPLSREIPVNTSETPTPLAGDHPYAHEHAPGDGGGRPTGRDRNGEPRRPAEPERTADAAGPPEPSEAESKAVLDEPGTSVPSEQSSRPRSVAEPEAYDQSVPEPFERDASSSGPVPEAPGLPEPEVSASGEHPAVPETSPSSEPDVPTADERQPEAVDRPEPVRPEAFEAEASSDVGLPDVPEVPHPVEAEMETSASGGTLPAWLDEASPADWDDEPLRGGSDEADEMVSADVDEEPSRDMPVDDEHAGRRR